MYRKLIYLISIVLVLGFASSAHAVYVDAEGGAGGNTVRASDGNPDRPDQAKELALDRKTG
jgi:hypothetical protein